MASFFLLYHPFCSIRFYSEVKLSLLPISLNSFCVSFSIVSQLLNAYLLSFSQANHILWCDRVLQNLRFLFCFFLCCERDKISQSNARGLMVTVMNNGVTLYKSLHFDNLAAKLLVGWLFLNIIIFEYCCSQYCLGNIAWLLF